MEYFLMLTVVLLITLILEKIYKTHLYHSLTQRIVTVGLFFVIGVLWDSFAIWQGDWVFPQGKNLGIRI